MINPVVLIVLDGWGITADSPGNAITRANIPFYKTLLNNYPNTLLEASGEAVGLPRGEDGNTETGHLNLGAGYIVPQDLARINQSIADGSFFKNRAFLGAIDHVRKYDSNLHLLGLIGTGGVHSNLEHLLALLQLTKEQNLQKVYLHLITDGRDSPPRSAALYLAQIRNFLDSLKYGEIASIMGRYYAMDRDKRWDRTLKAYQTLTLESGPQGDDCESVVEKSYQNNIGDEFILPTGLKKNGRLLPRIKDYDSVIFYNFRIDRPRQLTKAFVLKNFAEEANLPDFDPYQVKYLKKHSIPIEPYQQPFTREKVLEHLYFVSMTEYSQAFHVAAAAFPPHIVATPLGQIIEENGLSQLHMAESEKERFVTYYFNGQRERPFANQDTIIVPSPQVATYDLAPEMSAIKLTDELIKNLRLNKHHFILVNFANADMVAHTGSIAPTIQACESLDKQLSLIVPEVLKANGTLLITADHGNCEELINLTTQSINTEHSTNPVPLIAVSGRLAGKSLKSGNGILADISPTVLALLGLKKPLSMTGRNLLENIID